MKNILHIRNFLFTLLLLPSIVFASGNLKGVVTDSLTNETLFGANVMLVGTSLGSATNIEGIYSISVIPPGKYIVRCTYLGYKMREETITIPDNKTVELNFSLSYAIVEGEEVIVTAQALGQAAAINQQLSSNTIVNVVSEQKIKELPDANAAEALGRLPGVSIVRSGGEANKITLRGLNQNMTTITVDGIKLSPTDADERGIDLSAISQGSLSGIVLAKAITSDMEAEAIAGNVNFVTKTAPEIREIQFDAYGSYGAMDNTAEQYNFLGKYGERFFNNLLGVQVFANIERKNRSSEQYEVEHTQEIKDIVENSDHFMRSFRIKYSPEIRKRGGAKLLLDFRTPDEGIIKFNTEFNRTERRLSIMDRNYPTAADVSLNFRGQDINTDIKNFALQGENHLSDWQLNWSFSYSESSSETPYDYDMHMNEPSIKGPTGEVISGMKTVPEEFRKGTNYEELIPYALNNYDLAYINRVETRKSSNLDFEKTFFLDAKKAYNLFGSTGEVKLGVKYRSKYHRRNSTLKQSMYYNGSNFYDYVKLADGTVAEKDFEGYGFSNIQMSSGNLILLPNLINSSSRDIYGKYLLTPMYDPEHIRNWYKMNINGYDPNTGIYEYSVDNSETGTNYNLTESVTSGYVMNTLNIGSAITLIAGIRVEMDDNRYNAYYTTEAVTEWSVFNDTTTTHRETIFLPNFHLILKPTDYMNVRLAAFRGLTRPNFNYRLPTYVYGFKSVYLDEAPYVIMSNSNLKNADAWNFEVNVQLYSNTIGLFSISAFYKNIKNEVHQLWYVPIKDKATTDSLGIVYPDNTVPFSSSYSLVYPYNSDKPTRVWGFEVEHQTNLRFLPGLLSNIVLSYNLSLIKTETYTPAYRTVDYYVTVPGLPFPSLRKKVELYETLTRTAKSPELFGNISIGYDIDGFSARLSYFYQDEYVDKYSGDRYSNDIQKSFGRVDLSLKQKISDTFSVGLNVNNINNAEEGIYLGNTITGWRLEKYSYKYGASADFWLRVAM